MTHSVSREDLNAFGLRSVYLRSSHVDLDERFEPWLGGIDLEVQLRQQVSSNRLLTLHQEPGSANATSEGGHTNMAVDIDVAARFLFKDLAQAVELDGKRPEATVDGKAVAATVEARFSAVYDIRRESPPSKDLIEAFVKIGPIVHVWPFWREFLHSTCGRINVVPVVLPIMIVGEKGSQSGPAAAKSSTGPAKRKVAPKRRRNASR
ncbi:MAG: hypothetical protein AB7P08_10405 [Burkholderiales bacterium]